jgi:peptidoglycan/xylan/chitin deacetylase (PgdA/CDA1 family)
MNTHFYKAAKYLKFIPINLLSKLTRKSIILPFYHIVSDTESIHIKHLYQTKSIKQFEKELDFLLKNFKPIDFLEYRKCILEDMPLKNRFLLTFDDGLKEFYTIIAPILKRKGIPAMNFLNSGFVDNKDLFYRYKVSVLIEKLQTSTFSVSTQHAIKQWFLEQGITLDDNYKELLRVTYQQKETLDSLAQIISFDFKDYLNEEEPYLTSKQINELIEQGFHFGAHSIDHPPYHTIHLEEQLRQTKESIHTISSDFNLNYNTFSFPFTDFNVPKAFFNDIKSNVELTFGCAGLKNDSLNFNKQRIPFEIDGFNGEEILRGEYLYYIFKSFLNKNTIHRN